MDEAARLEKISVVLGELPGYWASARTSLVTPRHEWNERAIEDLAGLERFLDEEVREAWEQKDRAEDTLLEDALAATAGFRDWLASTPASLSGTATTLEPERWEQLVHHASGHEGSLAEIKRLLLRELLRYEQLLAQLEIDTTVPDEDEAPSGEGLTARVRDAARLALEQAARERLLDAGPIEAEQLSAELGWLPACGRSAELLAGPDGALILRIDPRDSSANTEAGQICLAIRHGLPGEGFLSAYAKSGRGVMRSHLWNRATREGWGLFVLGWTVRTSWEDGPFAGRSDLVHEGARILRVEAARLLAALEIHAEGYDLEEAAEAFRRRSGLDLEAAVHEVRCAQVDPLLGIGFLGYLELRRLEEEILGMGRISMMAVVKNPHQRPAEVLQAFREPAAR